MCVLLVEDEAIIREIMVECLLDAGFEVVEADSGDTAVELIRNPPKPFSVLVTDFHMPGRRDGAAVAECIRIHRPDIPVVITTGRPDVFDARQREELGYALLRKPYTAAQLIQLLSAIVSPA